MEVHFIGTRSKMPHLRSFKDGILTLNHQRRFCSKPPSSQRFLELRIQHPESEALAVSRAGEIPRSQLMSLSCVGKREGDKRLDSFPRRSGEVPSLLDRMEKKVATLKLPLVTL